MAEVNRGWGTPKIHGELKKLGFVEGVVVAALLPARAGAEDSLAHLL